MGLKVRQFRARISTIYLPTTVTPQLYLESQPRGLAHVMETPKGREHEEWMSRDEGGRKIGIGG
jgi:hypothetical protein